MLKPTLANNTRNRDVGVYRQGLDSSPIMPTVLEKLYVVYQTNPIIRAVMGILPIVSAADTALITKRQNDHRDNARIFFDELGNGNVQLTQENIESDDFLHAFVATAIAVSNTRKREKIRYFARLLTSSINSSEISTIDEYEEYLGILDELSCRELWILVILSRYEKEYSPQAEMSNRNPAIFWDDFSSEICSKFSIHPGELSNRLTRLNRSGLYETFNGYSSIVESSLSFPGRIGQLTPLYKKFKNLIKPEENEY